MENVNFNDQTLLANDPTITTKDNSLSFTGTVAVDPLNLLNGLALDQNLLLQPISWTFAHPVSEVSFNADMLNLLGSATVSYYDENGNLLHSTTSGGLGEQTFTYSNPDIAQVQITGSDVGTLTVDSVSYQDANPMVATVANPDSNPLISGHKWVSSNLTYSLPTSSGEYTSTGYQAVSGFQQLSGTETSEVQQVMANVSADTGVTLTQTTGTGANLRLGHASSIDTDDGTGAHTVVSSTVYGPGSSSSDSIGDIWLQSGSTASQLEIMKDVGQALGLQPGSFGGAHDSIAYSIMSNDTYPGGSPTDLSTVDAPSTLMQDDIAALQTVYGANFDINSGDTVYNWDPATGQEFINGVGQGAPADGKVFMTVWDGGGNDTFDFSAYTGHVRVDLQPGAWTSASQLSLANLGDGHEAPGNIAMAQLYQNDPQSLIENAIGGSGNDVIVGNSADNVLNGGAGNDRLHGSRGDDHLAGGSGHDQLLGGSGNDVLSGGGGNDTLYGNYGNDRLNGGLGADLLVGGHGDNKYVYDQAADSTGTAFDTIEGFNTNHDKIALPFAVSGVDHKVYGALNASSFDSDLAAGTSHLQAHHAELFVATSGTDAGERFLVIDANGQAGYQAGQDFVICLDQGVHLGHLSVSDFAIT